MPRMTIKVAADQIKIVRPSVECVGGRMNTEEPTARAHKVEKSCLLAAAHRKFAGCVEHHRGVALEVFGRKFRRVFRCGDFKGTGIPSKLCQDCLGKRYSVMPIAGRVCEIEDALWRALCTRAERLDCRRAADECDKFASPHNALPKPDQPKIPSTYRRALALRCCPRPSCAARIRFFGSPKQGGWSREFDDPIPLPRGRRLVTLRDAGYFITKLPKAE